MHHLESCSLVGGGASSGGGTGAGTGSTGAMASGAGGSGPPSVFVSLSDIVSLLNPEVECLLLVVLLGEFGGQ